MEVLRAFRGGMHKVEIDVKYPRLAGIRRNQLQELLLLQNKESV